MNEAEEDLESKKKKSTMLRSRNRNGGELQHGDIHQLRT